MRIPEGTLEVRFRPRGDEGKKDVTTGRQGSDQKDDPRLQGGWELTQQAIDTQLEIMRVESELKANELENARERADELLEQRILDEFKLDPEVIAVSHEVAKATEQRERAKRVV